MVEFYIRDVYGDRISTKENFKASNHIDTLDYAIVLAEYMSSVVEIAWGVEGCIIDFKIIIGCISSRIKLLRRSSRSTWEQIYPQDLERYFIA